VYQLKPFPSVCAYIKTRGLCKYNYYASKCKKTCGSGGATGNSSSVQAQDYSKWRRPYTARFPIIAKTRSYPSRCAYYQDPNSGLDPRWSGCKMHSTRMYCARTCSPCKGVPVPKAIDCSGIKDAPGWNSKVSIRQYKKQKYNSVCEYYKTLNYCRYSWAQQRCRQTCTGTGTDHPSMRKPYYATAFTTKKYSGRCAYYFARGACKSSSYIKQQCPRSCNPDSTRKIVSTAKGSAAGANDTLTTLMGFSCDKSANFVQNQPGGYRQSSLPMYVTTYSKAIAYCKAKCSSSCTGFFYQQHINGHRICGFYTSAIKGQRVAHNHKEGSICRKSSNYVPTDNPAWSRPFTAREPVVLGTKMYPSRCSYYKAMSRGGFCRSPWYSKRYCVKTCHKQCAATSWRMSTSIEALDRAEQEKADERRKEFSQSMDLGEDEDVNDEDLGESESDDAISAYPQSMTDVTNIDNMY